MKIAIFLPSLRGGGAERVALLLSEAFVEAGHCVDLVLMVANGEYMDQIPSGIRLIDLNCPRLWTSIPAFRRYLCREQPDAIVASMPLANGVAGWARLFSSVTTCLILSEHNAISLVFGDVEVRRYRVLQYLTRYIYRFADGIVAVSEGVAVKIRALPGINSCKIHVIHNPAYTLAMEEKASESCTHPWLQDRKIPVILSVGRLVKQKDFPSLIRAFDLVRRERPARLIILGEDQEREALEQLITKLELTKHVDMPGFVSNPWAWMSRSAVFVLSSQHEGFGNVLVEAMACGTSVVATDCPSGPSEILEAGLYGVLVGVGDVEALATGIFQMLDNPVSSETLKRRARQFSKETAANEYLRVISEGVSWKK